MARHTAAPSASITRSHETPKATAALAAHTANSTSVAPSRFSPPARPLPIALPTTPPAPAGSAPGFQCSAVSEQLLISSSANPSPRTAKLARELDTAVARARARRTAATPSASGNR